MLVLFGVRFYLLHLGGGDVPRIDAADTFALTMDLEHHYRRLLAVHGKELLKHDDDKVHGREIVVQQYYPV